MLQAIHQVVQFEMLRTLTRGRLFIWLLLAAFPSLLMILMQSQAGGNIPDEPLALMTFYLVPQISCMLGLLLWATPAVGAELEAQTWIYLATRPHGKTAIVLGKYLVAVFWTASAGVISAVGVAYFSQFPDGTQLAVVLSGLVLLASITYGGLYIFLGIVISRRATVIAVVYSLVMEGLISSLPATVNKLTVCYRLRALLAEWVGLDRLRSSAEEWFGYEPAWQHLVGLAIYALASLLFSLIAVQIKEFRTQGET